jgi:DnaJ-class molecular chaperone
MFSMFFGGGRRQRSGPRKGEDVVHQINVTLEVQQQPHALSLGDLRARSY